MHCVPCDVYGGGSIIHVTVCKLGDFRDVPQRHCSVFNRINTRVWVGSGVPATGLDTSAIAAGLDPAVQKHTRNESALKWVLRPTDDKNIQRISGTPSSGM